MCGILCALGVSDATVTREKVVRLSKCLRHRGPDFSGYWVRGHDVLGHERLALVGPENGAQPLVSADETVAVTANGEIYNHVELQERFGVRPRSESDCEVLLCIWQHERPEQFLNDIRGVFAFVVANGEDHFVARDPIGVCPLYWGQDANGATWVASEMKALLSECVFVEVFPPGHFYSSRTKELRRYYDPVWTREIPTGKLELSKLREAFEIAVVRRINHNAPHGAFLSGGLDSSLVVAVLNAHIKKMAASSRGGDFFDEPKLHTFCVGFEPNSPDLQNARQLAKFLGSIHHENVFTIQNGIDAIEDVIWYTETYDITTIRASVPMYLLSRQIKALGIKAVMSGEGSDEIFGGYLYFHGATNPKEFHEENVRLLENLHLFDCLRANKSAAAFGLEVRVPFLDRDFIDAAFSCDPKFKHNANGRIEKWMLRKAFDDDPIIPSSLLWRQKEQLSDGVGYKWIDNLIRYTSSKVSDHMFSCREKLYPYNTPTTKEAFYYREVFERLFPHRSAIRTVKQWVPKWSNSSDPSGRRQSAHRENVYMCTNSSN